MLKFYNFARRNVRQGQVVIIMSSFRCVHISGIPRLPSAALSDFSIERFLSGVLGLDGEPASFDIRVIRDQLSTECKGYCFLTFFKDGQAEMFIERMQSIVINSTRSDGSRADSDPQTQFLLLLSAEFSAPKERKAGEKVNAEKEKDSLPDLRVGRKSYPSKKKHADSVSCSDKSRMKMDARGFVVYKKKKEV